MKTHIFLAAALVVSACAKQPDEIAAADIGPNPYLKQSCRNLAKLEITETQNLENLSAAQKSAASGDAVGVLLLGMPVSSMSGNDKETAISVTKGRIQAIEQAKASRGCA